ncbi:hypothetical protein AG1IA_09772 [Rhizoctonia solani AG-1 IA]|uniref:Uncharacterized protein n=1 Tax=Thanatephorus cucumeris (strain AG1-IA) TaxID=983506 RepID=L8WHD1_THACA|nr:hypothetical protein AG1IA_09772 [Rhizoctonia solani AG-1 IA]
MPNGMNVARQVFTKASQSIGEWAVVDCSDRLEKTNFSVEEYGLDSEEEEIIGEVTRYSARSNNWLVPTKIVLRNILISQSFGFHEYHGHSSGKVLHCKRVRPRFKALAISDLQDRCATGYGVSDPSVTARYEIAHAVQNNGADVFSAIAESRPRLSSKINGLGFDQAILTCYPSI